MFQPGDFPNAAFYCGWYSLANDTDAFTGEISKRSDQVKLSAENLSGFAAKLGEMVGRFKI